MVDKFIGDGVMAIFGAPIAQENNAEMAIRAALDMQAELARFSLEVQERYHNEALRLHIGLHTGTVIVGSMGSSLMMNYTAIGDVVNLAARLQAAAGPNELVCSNSAYKEIQDAQLKLPFEPYGGNLHPGSLEARNYGPIKAWTLNLA